MGPFLGPFYSSTFLPVFVMAALAVICWFVYVFAGVMRRRDQLRAASEFQTKLLERASSAREFAEVLNTEAGMKILNALATEQEARPQMRILRTIQAGLVLLVLGFCFFFWVGESSAPMNEGVTGTVAVFATFSFGMGLALLIASGVSFRLAKRMGLISVIEQETAPNAAKSSQSERASS